MEFKLSREQLDDVQKYNKMYSYLSQSFTKTYFVVGEGEFSLFFYGQKGAVKTTFKIEGIEGSKRYFQIDYGKWTNGLSKLSFSDEAIVRLTEKFIKLRIEGSSDVINLGIIPCDKNSAEIDIIENFIPTQEAKAENKKAIGLTEELIAAISITTSMFSSVGRNNAIALFKNHVMYSDRSIVLKAKLEDTLPLSDEKVILHRFTAGVLPFLFKEHPVIQFVDDFEILFWDDGGGTSLVLVSEPCEISLPTNEELQAISPGENSGVLEVPHTNLQMCLNFFNGFYEASVWKPITFQISANKEASLYYRHPTTEITKALANPGDKDGEFIVGSETLMKLVNKAVDTLDEGTVIFRYDDEAPGVSCNIASLYEVVFAKLTE